MSDSGPEKVFLDLVYIQFPLCIVEFQLVLMDAEKLCSQIMVFESMK